VVKLWIAAQILNEDRAWAVVHAVGAPPAHERTTPAMTHERGISRIIRRAKPVPTGLGVARRLVLAVVGVSAVVVVASVSSAFGAASTVAVATSSNFGTVLTTGAGFALYTLPSDHDGMSSCSGSCASVWPALTVPAGTTPTAGTGVTGTVAAVTQANGTDQVTYNGSPLYTFVGDTTAGEVTGNGVGGFAVVTVSAPTTPTTAPAATTPTAGPTSPSAPTSPGTPTTAPAATTSTGGAPTPAPVTAPAASATSSGSGTASGASVPAPGPVATSPHALAFTGPGPALMGMVVVGAGLLALSTAMLVLVGDRARLAAGRVRANRAGRWLLGR
jgi:predicted lipoprotein with Yx(FWY)xxD motif